MQSWCCRTKCFTWAAIGTVITILLILRAVQVWHCPPDGEEINLVRHLVSDEQRWRQQNFLVDTITARWQYAYDNKLAFMSELPFPVESRLLRLSNGNQFHLLLNAGRKQKRKTSIDSQDSLILQQPFNPKGFHFGKIKPAEIIATISFTASQASVHCASAHSDSLRSPHYLLINPFPLDRYSGLFVPFLSSNLPQVLDREQLVLGLLFALSLGSSNIRLAFNSLHAGASVNHFHFQFWEFAHELPAEATGCNPQLMFGQVSSVEYCPSFPSTLFRFHFQEKNIDHFADSLSKLIKLLYSRSIPFNIIFRQNMLMLFPRQPHTPLDDINIGFPEISGELLCMDRDQFHHETAERVEQHWHDHVRLEDDVIDQLWTYLTLI